MAPAKTKVRLVAEIKSKSFMTLLSLLFGTEFSSIKIFVRIKNELVARCQGCEQAACLECRFNNGANGAVYYTEDSHYVWIPNGTERLEATFAASEFERQQLLSI